MSLLRNLLASLFLTCTLLGCAHHAATIEAPPETRLGWLTGCWQTADGVEENWTRSRQGDQLFGFSVTTQRDQRVFFEQLRIDTNENTATLHAYPKGIGPTSFVGRLSGDLAVEFVNPQNDYPQRIRYARDDERLLATISLMDNSKQNFWTYVRCD